MWKIHSSKMWDRIWICHVIYHPHCHDFRRETDDFSLIVWDTQLWVCRDGSLTNMCILYIPSGYD